jgi:ABC-type phosphonate transport system ATPase subunit
MSKTKYRKKKPDDIKFQMRGGEMLVWKLVGESRKTEPRVSQFISGEFISEMGGLCYKMLVDGEPRLIPCERFDLWDNLTQY